MHLSPFKGCLRASGRWAETAWITRVCSAQGISFFQWYNHSAQVVLLSASAMKYCSGRVYIICSPSAEFGTNPRIYRHCNERSKYEYQCPGKVDWEWTSKWKKVKVQSPLLLHKYYGVLLFQRCACCNRSFLCFCKVYGKCLALTAGN